MPKGKGLKVASLERKLAEAERAAETRGEDLRALSKSNNDLRGKMAELEAELAELLSLPPIGGVKARGGETGEMSVLAPPPPLSPGGFNEDNA